jgi:hypothetical protein
MPKIKKTQTAQSSIYQAQDITDFFEFFTSSTNLINPQAKVIDIPITKSHVLLALYLNPHPDIDRAIKQHHWTVHQLTSQAPPHPPKSR